ncbi:NepR family anti-sigma factor [Roseisalinus antarcticus]|uniref:Anti-sigma factor NepR domain-containing protein n=1 Tax=Roseisalinus antarcticus TaxID=254357 RepID=A0A1Y5SGC0_9RHOB|nr:NepR family anti-sigma factor [Roseisalinus antarcticus]SLN39480.1 hypothetical protein ROA7023_01512 [Roseisalinus antarcticus]
MTKGREDSGNIDAHLKRAFEQIQSDPLPERLLGLLDDLRKQDAEGRQKPVHDENDG